MGNNITAFSFVDFAVGFLMAEAMAHVVFSRAEIHFPSLFGYSSKANLMSGLLLASIAVEIYAFNYGFNATINNGVLVGAVDMLFAYALFGRFLHTRIQKKFAAVGQMQ